MNIEKAANCMAELGHVNRLSIYRLLVKAGPDGLPVGEIGRKLKIPGSTLSHHIQRLVVVGLVKQEKQKQTIFCQPLFKQLTTVINYLTSECCQGKSYKTNKC